MTQNKLITQWLWRLLIDSILSNIICVNLFVIVWGDVTTPAQRAIYAIAGDAVTLLGLSFGELLLIRRIICTHSIKILWVLLTIDIVLLPIFLYNPYTYLLCTVLLLEGAFSLFCTILFNEIRETLIPRANDRIIYSIRRDRVQCLGSIIGACSTFVLPLASWGNTVMFISMLGCTICCGLITTHALYNTQKYMRLNNLHYTHYAESTNVVSS